MPSKATIQQSELVLLNILNSGRRIGLRLFTFQIKEAGGKAKQENGADNENVSLFLLCEPKAGL